MARRTGIGMALGNWLGGRPDANPAAGATEDPDTGLIFDAQGNDVTQEAKKYGTGPVKQPGFAMRLFNPSGAAKADDMNLDYATLPAREAQQYKLANAEADDYARHAIAYAKGIKPEEVSDQEVQGVRAARGQTIKASGLSPEQYNQMIAAQEELKAGGPQAAGRYRALQEQGKENEERTFQDRGGDVNTGLARAEEAKAAGEQAKTIETNEPTRRRLQAGQLAAEEARQPLQEELNTQELVNRVSRSTQVDPQVVEIDRQRLARELGRVPTEEDLKDYETGNRLFAEKNITPLTLGSELNRASAINDSAPFVRQGIMNQARQQAAASSQPPSDVIGPVRYRPALGYEGNDPSKMWTLDKTNPNPLFYPSAMAAKMQAMDYLTPTAKQTGSANSLTLPGGARAVPISAPATNAVVTPSVTKDTFFNNIKNNRAAYPGNAPIDALGDAIAEQIGPSSSSPALQVGSSTLSYRPGKVYSDALLGNNNGIAGQLSGDQVMNYVDTLPPEQQNKIYTSAWSRLSKYK